MPSADPVGPQSSLIGGELPDPLVQFRTLGCASVAVAAFVALPEFRAFFAGQTGWIIVGATLLISVVAHLCAPWDPSIGGSKEAAFVLMPVSMLLVAVAAFAGMFHAVAAVLHVGRRETVPWLIGLAHAALVVLFEGYLVTSGLLDYVRLAWFELAGILAIAALNVPACITSLISVSRVGTLPKFRVEESSGRKRPLVGLVLVGLPWIIMAFARLDLLAPPAAVSFALAVTALPLPLVARFLKPDGAWTATERETPSLEEIRKPPLWFFAGVVTAVIGAICVLNLK